MPFTTETLPPEHQRAPTGEQLLADADGRVFDWQADSEFFAYASERLRQSGDRLSVDPQQGPNLSAVSSHIDYWSAFGNFVAERLYDDTSLDETEKQATLVLAATPEYVIAQHQLNQERAKPEHRQNWQKINHLKDIASEFTTSIRHLVELSPDMSADRLKKNLAAQAQILSSDPAVLATGDEALEAVVRGVQHELVLKQIIEAVDGVEEVTPSESLGEDRRGNDLYVHMEDGTTFAVDAKASQSKIEHLKNNPDYEVENSTRPIFALDTYPGREGPPHLIISSQTADKRNLGDRFYIRDPESVRIKASRLSKAFEAARHMTS